MHSMTPNKHKIDWLCVIAINLIIRSSNHTTNTHLLYAIIHTKCTGNYFVNNAQNHQFLQFRQFPISKDDALKTPQRTINEHNNRRSGLHQNQIAEISSVIYFPFNEFFSMVEWSRKSEKNKTSSFLF